MTAYQEDPGTNTAPASKLQPAMFGYRDGVAWVADDVFVTRYNGGDLLVERWDGRGVRTATVRKDCGGEFLRAMWLVLNEIAVSADIPLR